jgi:DNA-binding beta-propeller fold protein YncE
MGSPDPVRKFEGEGATEWSTVHGIAITPDGVVWIADRDGNRIQQFKIDGTYIREAFVSRETTVPAGTVYNFSFSPDLKYVYVPDGSNKQVHILERESLKEVGTIGNCGGQMPGCFNHLHVAATDSGGNLYTGEAAVGARIQRWNIVK